MKKIISIAFALVMILNFAHGVFGMIPVESGWNCESLSAAANFEVRWRTSGSSINFQLVGKVTGAQYMAFGVSGDPSRTFMTESDVVVTGERDGKFSAVDYYLTGRKECSDGSGVCPDTMSDPPGNDDVTDVSGSRKGDMVQIMYTVPMGASETTDRAYKSGTDPTFVSWAIGGFNPSTNLPTFHAGEMNFPRKDYSFVFGRDPVNNCPRGPVDLQSNNDISPPNAVDNGSNTAVESPGFDETKLPIEPAAPSANAGANATLGLSGDAPVPNDPGSFNDAVAPGPSVSPIPNAGAPSRLSPNGPPNSVPFNIEQRNPRDFDIQRRPISNDAPATDAPGAPASDAASPIQQDERAMQSTAPGAPATNAPGAPATNAPGAPAIDAPGASATDAASPIQQDERAMQSTAPGAPATDAPGFPDDAPAVDAPGSTDDEPVAVAPGPAVTSTPNAPLEIPRRRIRNLPSASPFPNARNPSVPVSIEPAVTLVPIPRIRSKPYTSEKPMRRRPVERRPTLPKFSSIIIRMGRKRMAYYRLCRRTYRGKRRCAYCTWSGYKGIHCLKSFQVDILDGTLTKFFW